LIITEVRFLSSDFSEDDQVDLRAAFEQVGPVRATAAWVPAAGPGPAIDLVLTFLGQTLASLVLEKTLEQVWLQVEAAWTRFNGSRRARALRDAELIGVVIRTDDLEFRINMLLDAGSPEVGQMMATLYDRLTHGALRSLRILTIDTPCQVGPDGHWEAVGLSEAAPDADPMVWHVRGTAADGGFGFYDARSDRWVE
jgi:hypothetical protein